MIDLPSPLTPPDCDLRDFAFMPLDVQRLRDSDLASLESPEACWAALLLWCASWHQVPAASLPDDDRVLAKLAGYGRVVSAWQEVKEGALRNFVKCSDGRLYHPLIAEKAMDAMKAKVKKRWESECARIKKHNDRHGTNYQRPSLDAFIASGQRPLSLGTNDVVPGDIPPLSPSCPEGNDLQGRGIGRGIGTEKENPSPQDAGTNVIRLRPVTADTDRAIPMTLDWRPSEGIFARMAMMGVLKTQLTDAAVNEFASYWQSRGGQASQGEWEHKLATRLKKLAAVPQRAAAGGERFNNFESKDYGQGTDSFAPHEELFSDVDN